MQTVSNQTTPSVSRSSRFYAISVVLSVVISWGIFSQFLLSGDASIGHFFEQAFSTSVSTLLSSDIIITAVIFLTFARIELKRLGMPANRLALYALATCCVGICCGLALFLYQREQWLNSHDHSA